MLIGICARQRPFVPPAAGLQAVGQLDFVNGSYSWNGTTLTAADVVDQTGWITANGLELQADPSSGANLIYSPMTTYLGLCQFSAIFEVNILQSTSFPGAKASQIFWMSNAGLAFFVQAFYQHDWELAASDGNTTPFIDDGINSISTGIHKLGITQTDDMSSLSVDGFSTASDLTGVVLPVVGFPMSVFAFGLTQTANDVAFHLRSATFYDPVENAQLQELTA
jgi:hypothetical protein